MAQNWREIVEAVDVDPEAASGPAGDDSADWYQLVAAFGTKSFVRALTDGDSVVLECAPPGADDVVARAFANAGWDVDEESTPWSVSRPFPGDEESFRPLWVTIAKVCDAFRADDTDALVELLEESAEASEPATPEDEADAAASGDEDADKDEEEQESEEPAESSDDGAPARGGAFETIGDDDREALESGEFASVIRLEGDVVEVVLGFGDALGPGDFDALGERLVRNLRGKYDVDAKVVGGNEVGVRLERLPTTRIALHVLADRVVSDASPDEAEGWTREYFATLENLGKSGIDPLVFLGVRASGRDGAPAKKKDDERGNESASSSAFETIGDDEPEEDEGPVLVVADDDEEVDDLDPGDEAEVVFGETEEVSPHDPLRPGRYEDPRLDRPDATTSLVDVVLRHPGYSDRRIGQVLSILLSLDYARCLEIAERAPTVLAWGVARERAQTMKTVIEGAGGRVLLCEPDEFGEP